VEFDLRNNLLTDLPMFESPKGLYYRYIDAEGNPGLTEKWEKDWRRRLKKSGIKYITPVAVSE